MSLFSFVWDLDQDAKLSEQTEKVAELERRIEVIEGWIRYLDKRITDEQEQKREPV